jgi:hypothetical protein
MDPFVSVADLSDYLGRDVTADNGAALAVGAACDIVRDVTEQDFNAGTSTISLDGTGTDVLVLPQRPALTVGSVTVNGGTVTDYQLDGARNLLLRGSAGSLPRPQWPRGRQNVRVTYAHGYADAAMPQSIVQVALSIASRLVVQGVAQTETIGDVTINYGMAATDLTNGEQAILYGYLAKRSF